MVDPNKGNDFPDQIRKAFVGTEPKVPGPVKPKPAEKVKTEVQSKQDGK